MGYVPMVLHHLALLGQYKPGAVAHSYIAIAYQGVAQTTRTTD